MPELNSFEQDYEKYIDDFIAYINLVNINNEQRIRNILDRSVKREVREWYNREFDNKNWELQNVLDNSAIGATIAHIRGANAVAITGTVTSFPNVPLELIGIRSGQRLFRIKKHFPSTDRYLRMFEIGALKQGGHESVSSYWAKILKYGDQLGYTPAQKKTQFMSGVRDDIKEEIYRIGQHRPINDILDSLAELELRRGVLGPPPSYLSYTPVPPAISNKTPPPIPPKNIEQLRYSYESDNPFDGPPVLHKPDKLRSARIDRLESIMGKVADTVGSVADS
ncbi:8242_t:CDS:2, partial [Dentiscutata erythropus]